MKKTILILFILLPLISSARIGYSYNYYSFFYGGLFSQYKTLYNFEILYDLSKVSCTSKGYYGLGLNYSRNSEFDEFGLKFQSRIFRNAIIFGRNLSSHEYIFLQTNYKYSELINQGDINIRPGLGFMSNINFFDNKMSLRSSLQISYNLNDVFDNQNNKLLLELKIGIGINPKKFKK